MKQSGILWLEIALAVRDSCRREKLKKYVENLSWDEIDFERAALCLEAARSFVGWKADSIEIDPRIIKTLAPPRMAPEVAKAKLLDLLGRRLARLEGVWAPSFKAEGGEMRFTANAPDAALEVNAWEAVIQLADASSARALRLLLCDHCGVTFVTETKTESYHSSRCRMMAGKRRRGIEIHKDSAARSRTL